MRLRRARASSSASPTIEARLLRALRDADGDPAPRARHPGPVRRGLPARARSTPLTGVEQIPNSDAHAWVEVYFPGYGWVHASTRPAAAGRRPSRCPSGKPVGRSPPPRPSPSLAPADAGRPRAPIAGRRGAGGRHDRRRRRRRRRAVHRRSRCCCSRSSALVAFLAWRRGPRGADDARGRRTPAIGRLARAVRVRAAPDPDRLRVRGGPRRGPARRPARAPDRRDGEGRGRLRPARRSATTGSRRCATSYRRLRVGLLRLAVPARATGADALGADAAARRRLRARRSAAPLARVSAWAASSRRPREVLGQVHRPDDAAGRRGTRRPRSRRGRTTTSRTARAAGRTGSAAATLKTPSWPTTIDHGCVAGGVAVAGDLGPVERARAARLRRARARSAGERRPDPRRDVGERLAARRPGLERASPPRREDVAPARARSRSRWRPSHSPWPISMKPGIGADAGSAAPNAPLGRPSPSRSASAVCGRPAERRVDDLERRAGRDGRAGGACGGRAARATQRGLASPDRARAASRPGPGTGPRR